jgi:hypothetical protein
MERMSVKIDYSKLTDSEIDELMAELMGWDHSNGAYWKPCDEDDKADELVYLERNWHPSSDLNQTWKCEQFIKDSEFAMDYCRELVEIVGKSYERFIYATARQRCIAMLMAVEEE